MVLHRRWLMQHAQQDQAQVAHRWGLPFAGPYLLWHKKDPAVWRASSLLVVFDFGKTTLLELDSKRASSSAIYRTTPFLYLRVGVLIRMRGLVVRSRQLGVDHETSSFLFCVQLERTKDY